MSMAYTLHQELVDGTFETAPFATYTRKRDALRIGRACAKGGTPEVSARIHVVDSRTDLTIKSFKVEMAV